MSGSSFAEALAARLAAARTSLPSEQAQPLERYYHLLQRWSRRMNLTALPLDDYPSATLDRLIVEPVLASRLVPDGPAARWFDLGSGGGSPAIPLRVLRPRLALTMVESRERKCAFLREAVRQLSMAQVTVVCDRFETLMQAPARSADLVTIRAVRLDESVLGLLGHLVSHEGRVLLFGWDSPAPLGFQVVERTSLPAGSVLTVLCPEPG